MKYLLKYNDYIFNNFKENINPKLYLTKEDNYSFEEKIKKYQIDQLGNVFYIDVKNNIVKIDAISAKAINYAALSNGEAEIIDVSNPFSVLVYYPNFFKAKILDVNLSEIADYDLRSNYPNSFFSLVCTAPVNGFWAYDEFTRKLFKLDGNFQSKQQSQDIYLYTKKIIKPNYLCASKEEVFLNDPKVGILVFDFFGFSGRFRA